MYNLQTTSFTVKRTIAEAKSFGEMGADWTDREEGMMLGRKV